MLTKYLKGALAIMMAIVAFSACERSKDAPSIDPRDAFVGDYAFSSTGNIDLYAGAVKVISIPMDQVGELSIVPGDKDDAVWVIASRDSALAYVKDNQLIMEPTTDKATFRELVMEMSFTYSNGTLKDSLLSLSSDVEITASYREHTLFGTGTVDIVATKKK